MSGEDFERYVRENYERFVRFARGMVRSLAEDAVQAAVLKLWVRVEEVDASRVDALFFTALRNVCIDLWRREAREHGPNDAARTEGGGETPERVSLDGEAAEAVSDRFREARLALNPRERRALAIWLDGHPPREEAGRLLGVTAGAYSSAVHTGSRKLARSLAGDQAFLLEALRSLGAGRILVLVAKAFEGDHPNQRQP